MQKLLENTFVFVENGEYVVKKEMISSQPGPGEILVKIAYSTCDPCDAFVASAKMEGQHLG